MGRGETHLTENNPLVINASSCTLSRFSLAQRLFCASATASNPKPTIHVPRPSMSVTRTPVEAAAPAARAVPGTTALRAMTGASMSVTHAACAAKAPAKAAGRSRMPSKRESCPEERTRLKR